MTETITYEDRKARKPYFCDYCGGRIEKGEVYHYYKGKYDGRLFDWRSHLSCQRVADAIWEYCDPDEGMGEDEFQSGCQEVCQRFICPDCPEWNKEYEECNKDETYCIARMDEFFKTHEMYRAERQAYYETWKCRLRKR